MKDILVIGFSTRNVVCSGRRAGYNMYALDSFCDHDLKKCANAAIQFDIEDGFNVKSIKAEKILELIDSFGVEFDAIIPGSGFETMDFPGCKYPILRNDISTIQKVSDKSLFAGILEKMGLPHPRVFSYYKKEDIEYPVMIKPVSGGGGIFNQMVKNESEMEAYMDHIENSEYGLSKSDMIIQEFIRGLPTSISVISTKNKANSIAVNEQLIGTEWLTDMPFAFCGNITPFESQYSEQMKDIAEKLIMEMGLIGSNGVDFLLTENGPVIIELNARFQGSLDTVEMATGINVFDAHMKAFQGHEYSCKQTANKYAGRVIIYADKDFKVTDKLQKTIADMETADIPNSGHIIHADEPITSILASGHTKDEVLSQLKNSVMFIRES